MKIQTLRKTPVGSVIDVQQRGTHKFARGVLTTPIHTGTLNSRINFYVRGVGNRVAKMRDIKHVIATPMGIPNNIGTSDLNPVAI